MFIPDHGSRILMLTFSHPGSRIPDPGSRGQKGTQSRIPDPDPQHWLCVCEIFCITILVPFRFLLFDKLRFRFQFHTAKSEGSYGSGSGSTTLTRKMFLKNTCCSSLSNWLCWNLGMGRPAALFCISCIWASTSSRLLSTLHLWASTFLHKRQFKGTVSWDGFFTIPSHPGFRIRI